MTYAYTPLHRPPPRRRLAQWTLLGVVVLALLLIWDDPDILLDLDRTGHDPEQYPVGDGTCGMGGAGGTQAAGVPGFTVLTDAWYRSGVLHLYGDAARLPAADEISSGRRLRVEVHTGDGPVVDGARCLSGTTVFVNAGAGSGKRFVRHYYHFAAEYLLGAFAALGVADQAAAAHAAAALGATMVGGADGDDGDDVAVMSAMPDRMVIPWIWWWRDRWGLNDAVATGLFGDDVIEAKAWRRLTGRGEWIHFERVAVVDRYASHRHNPLADAWNKMALPIFAPPPPPGFWDGARHRMWRSLGLAAPSGTGDTVDPRDAADAGSTSNAGDATDARDARAHPELQPETYLPALPRVVYVDRQGTGRRLWPGDHAALVRGLAALDNAGRASVRIVQLEKLDVAAQIEVAASATVMLGVHGNGLTHELWMPARSALVELFPPGAFIRDYQAVAEALGHPYVCIQNDTVLTQSQWADGLGSWDDRLLHSSKPFPVDADTVLGVVDRLLADLA